MQEKRLSTDDKKIYFDCAATTRPNLKAIEATIPYMKDEWQNPSSLYADAVKAKEAVEVSRSRIAEFIGATPDEIYFTSGGSESNCWAIQGFVHYWIARGYKPVVITSTIEHKSIIECVENLCVETHFVGVRKKGIVNKEQLEGLLERVSRDTENVKILVSIQMANNEIGWVQDIEILTRLVHKYSGVLHTDAVQVIGHLPVDVHNLDVDMLSASAHKFGGLKGQGFLYIKQGIEILPLIYGSQNNGMRGGTENVIGIVNMATALIGCNISKRMIDSKYAARDSLVESLERLPYSIDFNQSLAYSSLPTIVSVTIQENVTAEGLLYLLDTANIQVSAGSACNSRSDEPSHVLKAIGLSDENAMRTIRISFDESITVGDISRFVAELDKAIKVMSAR